ncbi:MAG: hypothetical protein H6737_03905 [Alphaproteobacteria bacterium]|nr:hypothetical protein [Alphaproteobacteria bacterium]
MRVGLLVLGLVGCGTDAEVVETLDLSGLLGDEDPGVTGVDVTGDGAIVLSTWTDGLWRIEDGEAEQLLTVGAMVDAGLPSSLTDVAVLGDGRIAMTVPGIGLLYDPADGSVVQHFCYEPGDWGDWEVQRQETDSLAYDAATDRLIAQPVTLTDERPDRADVAEFDRTTGTPLAWHTLADRRFLASALAVTPDGILLAEDGVLYDYALGDDAPVRRTDLGRVGLAHVEGLAVTDERLLVLDGRSYEIAWVRAW